MSNRARTALLAIMLTLGFAPMSVVMTMAVSPVWSWFESLTGIESMGHSGPATWCFVFTYGFGLAGGLCVLFVANRRPPSGLRVR
jgi:hypothetical protein